MNPPVSATPGTSRRARYRKRLEVANELVLAEHRVRGLPILPGVVHLEMALAAARSWLGPTPARFRHVAFGAPLIVEEGEPRVAEVELERSGDTIAYRISSAPGSADLPPLDHVAPGPFQEHSRGRILALDDPPPLIDVRAHESRCSRGFAPRDLYAWYRAVGLEHGTIFQTIERLYFGDDAALGWLAAAMDPRSRSARLEACHLHPGILDGALQTLGALFAGESLGAPAIEGAPGPFLPYALDEVRVHRDLRTLAPGEPVVAFAWREPDPRRAATGPAERARGHALVADSSGTVLIELRGVTGVRAPRAKIEARVGAPLAATPSTGAPDGRGVVARPASPVGDSERRRRLVESAVRDSFARALGLDPRRFDPERSFQDQGVDSMLGLEALKSLESTLGISEIAPPLLFDHPSPRRLARHLADVHGAALDPKLSDGEEKVPPEGNPTPTMPAPDPARALDAIRSRVPILDRLGLELVVTRDGERRLRLPPQADNLNHLGTFYAGALFGFAEAACVVALLEAFPEPGFVFVLTDTRIRFQRAVAEPITARVALDKADAARIAGALAARGETTWEPVVELGDAAERPVASLALSFLLRAKGAPARARMDAPAAPDDSATAPRVVAPRVGPPRAPAEPIAIVGYAGRFPGAADALALWERLRDGRDCVGPVPPERWNMARFYHPDPRHAATSNCPTGGFVQDVDVFDPLFFQISPLEARRMDPQQRIFLETAYRTLEHAGYGGGALGGTRTGVFVGVGAQEYVERAAADGFTEHVVTGSAFSVLASRIGYFLDLRGPALALDTACSTSLVAIHQAIRALRVGDCDQALAGAVHLNLHPRSTVAFARMGALSPAGRSHPFDDRADGFVPSEGAGAVLLKPLSAALADGDTIHGLVLGSAINNDGRTNGMTAPSAAAQADVVTRAWADAGVDPTTIGYVEAHGTGTALGDPIEVAGLGEAFGRHTSRRQFCRLGSVKANLGHAETAAGMASLLKVLLALRHHEIPPTIHFEVPNRHVRFESTPLVVCDRSTPWRRRGPRGEPRRAGVSGFGFSGTNAHLVIEEAPLAPEVGADREAATPEIVLLSARTSAGLERSIEALREHLEREPRPAGGLCDVAFTLATGRFHFEHRAAVVAGSLQELATHLGAGDGPRRGTATPADELGSSGITDLVARVAALSPAERAELARCTRGPLAERVLEAVDPGGPALGIAPDRPDRRRILDAAAALWVAGAELEPEPVFATRRPRRVPLPGTPFDYQRLWLDAGFEATAEEAGSSRATTPERANGSGRGVGDGGVGLAAGTGARQRLLGDSRGALARDAPDDLYDLAWAPRAPAGKRQLPGGWWLLLGGRDPLTDLLVDELARRGGRAVVVERGTRFEAVADDRFRFDPARTEDYRALIQALRDRDPLVGALHLWSADPDDAVAEPGLDTLERALDCGVRGATFLAQALAERGRAPLELWLVSAGAQSVADHPASPLAPARAPLWGLARVIPRELPWIRTHAIDLPRLANRDPQRIHAAARDLIEVMESAVEGASALALRDGRWWERGLAPLAPTPRTERAAVHPLPRDGTYLLTGGFGGLALAVAAELAARGRPKLWLCGRTALPAEETWDAWLGEHGGEDPTSRRIEAIRTLRSRGADVTGVSADITDPAEVSALFARIAGAGRPLDVVIHAAGVLRDRSIPLLDRTTFEAPLAPKVAGTWRLHELTRAEAHRSPPLLVVFSSMSALLGPPGQANHTVANAFEDAVVHHRRRLGLPAVSINWGFWGEVGVVAAPRYREALAAQGIEPISTHDGIEALFSVLASGRAQVAVCKLTAASPLRAELGIRASGARSAGTAPARAVPVGSGARSAADDPVRAAADSIARSARDVPELADGPAVEAALDEVVTAYEWEALARLGLFSGAGSAGTATELAKRAQVAARHTRLFRRVLEHLAARGMLAIPPGASTGDPVFHRAATTTPTNPDDAIAAVAKRYPAAEAQIELVRRCGPRLDEVLRGACDPLQVLFPGGSLALAESLYERAPAARFVHRLAAAALDAALTDLARVRGRSSRPNILEIGAGTGATTRALIDVARSHGAAYRFTDVSPLFLARARASFGIGDDFLAQPFDVERDPESQGVVAGSMDVVVAANVVHATRRLASTLANLARCLRPGGLLLAIEVTRPGAWLDITFGLTEGWWLFQDTELRTDSPLLTPASWLRVLADRGYEDARAFPDASSDPGLPQHLLLARAPRTISTGASSGRSDAPAQVPAGVPQRAAGAGGAGDEDARVHRIESLLMTHLARELEIHPDQIGPRTSFQAMGIDSVLAVRVVEALSRLVGEDLPATTLFDHPHVRALARHLATRPGTDAWASAPAATSAPAGDAAAPPAPAVPRPTAPRPPPLEARTPPAPRPARASPAVAPGADEPIAIVGLAVTMPGASDTEALWDLLTRGRDAIGEVPAARWELARWYDPRPDVPGKTACRWGGFLDDIEGFDAEFFGIPARQAELMDPQQRLFLEAAWRCIEDAGYAGDRIHGSRTAVFAGATQSEYLSRLYARPEAIEAYTIMGNTPSVVSNRVSYQLDLRGPSVTVDTACSSSLVAVHLAAEALRRGECDAALAGGVNVLLEPHMFVNLSRGRALAPDGRAKAFDARADGFVRGEGVAVVLLEPLSRALAGGAHVYAVIRGSAVNQDGRTNGLTAPSGPSQVAVLEEAYRRAGVDPATVSLLEAHGTGTGLGDPIEVQALTEVLGRGARQRCALGSIKSQIGHLEWAAGVAGLVKAVLALERRTLPPTLHFESPNAHLRFERTPFYVNDRPRPWPSADGPRRAAVSAFGFAGTNVHVVLEEAPSTDASAPAEARARQRPWHVVTLSARSSSALEAAASALRGRLLDEDLELADACFTLATGRAHHECRLAFPAESNTDAADVLGAWLGGGGSSRVAHAKTSSRRRPRVAFLYPGQGCQHLAMGRELAASEPTFASSLARVTGLLDDALAARGPARPLAEVISPRPDETVLLHQTGYSQPAIFAVEVALTELWRSWGIECEAVLGHSLGEITAAWAAGILPLDDAATLVAERAYRMQSLPENGAMAVVFASEPEVSDALAREANELSIAAVNGPGNVVVSGARDALGAFTARLLDAGIDARMLAISIASHSPLMDPILDGYERVASRLRADQPRLRFVSTLLGRELPPGECPDSAYWRRQIREPVRFADAFAAVLGSGIDTFVEMGPRPILVGLGRALAEARGDDLDGLAFLGSIERGESEWLRMLDSVAQLHVRGAAFDWAAFDHGRGRRRVPLPTYPFERRRHWIERPAEIATAGAFAPTHRPSTGSRPPSAPADLAVPSCVAEVPFTEVVSAATRHATRAASPAERQSWREWSSEADAIASAACEGWLAREGWLSTPGSVLALHDLTAALGGGGRFARLAERWLDSLAGDGVLARQGETWVARRPADGAAFARRLAMARVRFPEQRAPLTLLERAANELPEIVRGRVDPLEVLFPGGSIELAEELYERVPAARYLNAVMRAAFARLVHHRAPGPLRVLEVGAGTGGTASSLVPALADALGASAADGEVRYAFTDLSPLLLERARKKLAAWPFVDFGLLDVGRDPLAQGWSAASVDVVVAANVLHATPELGRTIEHLATLLAPGGWLLAIEVTRPQRALDLTFALTSGWWSFRDAPLRTEHPLLDATGWRGLLARHGFGEVVAIPADRDEAAALGQEVLLARREREARPRAVSVAHPPARVAPSGHRDEPRDRLPPSEPVAPPAQRARADADRPLERSALEVVRGAFAGVLGTTPDRVDPERTFQELGVDSLMGVDAVGAIKDRLALRVLTPTLLFEHPTPAELARYLARAEPTAVSRATAAAPPGVAAQAPAAALAAPDPSARADTLTAVVAAPGTFDCVQLVRLDASVPGAGEIRIRVAAAGLNAADVLTVAGSYPNVKHYPARLGQECAGWVEATGAGVTEPRVGDTVFGFAPGALAESVCTRAEFVLRAPARLDLVQAAAIPVVFGTAHHCLHDLAHLSAGETVLVQAAAGGVGLAAVALARRAGARVIGTAGGPVKVDYLRSLGVEHVIDYRASDFVAETRAFTGGRGVDVILDSLGGDAVARGLELLAPRGRFVEIGIHGLAKAPPVDAAALGGDRAFFVVNLLETVMTNPDRVRAVLHELAGLFERGELAPSRITTFRLEELRDAIEHIARRRNIGKVVVRMPRASAALPVADTPRRADAGIAAVAPATLPRPSPPADPARGRDVAIVGLAARFPGAPDCDALWRLLATGGDAVGPIPRERWDHARYFHPDPEHPGTAYCDAGGFLDDVAGFDPLLFRIAPPEARRMDPQQRLFLEAAHQAAENAGYGGDALARTATGVFAGVVGVDYFDGSADADLPEHLITGTPASILASRLAYLLDLHGPCMALDTSCSSSLVALHLAIQSLRRGECSFAFAGGVQLMLRPWSYVALSRIGALASGQRCRAFDHRADGFVPGEGVGVVLLRPLDDALAAGDTIHAVLRGSALNNDGRTNGITAPNPAAQKAVLEAAWRDAGITPDTLSYVEAHGTGTALGDPIEVEGLRAAFDAQVRRRQVCRLGSIKSNFGHCQAAGGIASLIKVVLALGHRELPPTLHVDAPNPHIHFEDTPFVVNDRLVPWPRAAHPRRAGISSFGVSGTNAHLVVEEAPSPLPRLAEHDRASHLLVLSARTDSALAMLARHWADHLAAHPDLDLGDVCFTASVGRAHRVHRLAIVAGSVPGCAEALARFAAGQVDPRVTSGRIGERRAPRIALALEPGTVPGSWFEELTAVRGCFTDAEGTTPENRFAAGLAVLGVRADAEPASAEIVLACGRAAEASGEPGREIVSVPTSSGEAWRDVLLALARLYVRGVPLDLGRLDPASRRRRIPLPTYPFERKRYWIDLPEQRGEREGAAAPMPTLPIHPLLDGGPTVRAARQEPASREATAVEADDAAVPASSATIHPLLDGWSEDRATSALHTATTSLSATEEERR